MVEVISVSVLIVTALLSAAPRALADAVISGPSCVVDGNTIQVGGKLRDGKCWGGIDVRLHGSKAPQLNRICKDSRGREWPCGRVAASTLSELIRLTKIDCYHHDGDFIDRQPLATCISGRVDLASEMVLKGMGRAADENKPRYIVQENAAKKARRGIWK